VRDYETL